jgi:hypothetical protein
MFFPHSTDSSLTTVLEARAQLTQAALLEACSQTCSLLQQSKISGEGGASATLLPGAPLALAAVLVHETLACLSLFLQVGYSFF